MTQRWGQSDIACRERATGPAVVRPRSAAGGALADGDAPDPGRDVIDLEQAQSFKELPSVDPPEMGVRHVLRRDVVDVIPDITDQIHGVCKRSDISVGGVAVHVRQHITMRRVIKLHRVGPSDEPVAPRAGQGGGTGPGFVEHLRLRPWR